MKQFVLKISCFEILVLLLYVTYSLQFCFRIKESYRIVSQQQVNFLIQYVTLKRSLQESSMKRSTIKVIWPRVNFMQLKRQASSHVWSIAGRDYSLLGTNFPAPSLGDYDHEDIDSVPYSESLSTSATEETTTEAPVTLFPEEVKNFMLNQYTTT